MLAHLFEEVGVHRVDLEVYAFNPRAQRSYEKCGFVVEGRLRESLLWGGERVDTIVMGLLRADWRPAARRAGQTGDERGPEASSTSSVRGTEPG
jgi:RimJ/RimL family protein N-acetyltransferase